MGTTDRTKVRTSAIPIDGSSDDVGAPDGLEATRAEARDLAQAGRAAIRRALSGDSRKFLRSAMQRGGE